MKKESSITLLIPIIIVCIILIMGGNHLGKAVIVFIEAVLSYIQKNSEMISRIAIVSLGILSSLGMCGIGYGFFKCYTGYHVFRYSKLLQISTAVTITAMVLSAAVILYRYLSNVT